MGTDRTTDLILQMNSLLLGDTIKRVDSMVLEIRHIQGNIIRLLREPVFYCLLRYEEDYLWGKYRFKFRCTPEEKQKQKCNGNDECENYKPWIKMLENKGILNVDEIAKLWVLILPSKSGDDYFEIVHSKYFDDFKDYFDKKKYKDNYRELDFIYQRRSISRGWGDGLIRSYNALVALQALKRLILRDKILLVYWGNKVLKLNAIKKSSEGEWGASAVQAIGRFITIRSGVMFRMKEYINRIHDLNTPIERDFNLSTVEYPHPMTTRRKEQGFYTEVLAERAKKYHKARHHILLDTKDIAHDEVSIPHVHHRWTHDPSSSYDIFRDDLFFKKEDLQERKCDNPHSFVNSSFWMNDRPDLQPVIAHELSHYFVDAAFGDVGESELKYCPGAIGKLIRNISKVFYLYKDPLYADARFPIANLEIIRDISTDLVASSRNSHAYLWSLFLENIGLDMYESLETPESRCDLTMLRDAERAHHALQYDQDIESENHLWAIRLFTICHWVEKTTVGHRHNKYAEDLIKGIVFLTEILLVYIENYTPLNIANGRGASFFIKLSNELRGEINNSEAVKRIYKNKKEWYKKAKNFGIQDNIITIDMFLPGEITGILLKYIEKIKNDRYKNRFLPIKSEVKEELNKDLISLKNNNSISSIQDIPWLLFMMRGKELVLDKHDTQVIFEQLTPTFNPGYDLYSIALEIHVWLRSGPLKVLRRVIGNLEEFLISLNNKNLEKYSGNEEDVLKKILKWLDAECCHDDLLEGVKLIENKYFSNCVQRKGDLAAIEDSAVDLTATDGSAVDLILKKKTRNNVRNKEKLCASNNKRIEKLGELKKILSELNLDSVSKYHELASLVSYLDVTSSVLFNKHEDDLKEIIESILQGFKYIENINCSSNDNLFDHPLTLIHMTMCETRTFQSEDIKDDFLNPEKPRFFKQKFNESGVYYANGKYHEEYALMLGRHDIIGVADDDYLAHTPEFCYHKSKSEIKELSVEKQRPHTVRSERALPFNLFATKKSDNSLETLQGKQDNLKKLCAVMHIRLTGRDSRLNFVLRIKEGLKKITNIGEPPSQDPLVKPFADKIEFNKDTLFCMLTEGGNDVILFFFFDKDEDFIDYNKHTYNVMKQVFEFQRAVLQDFLVDNVETSPSLNCMSAFSYPYNELFSLDIIIRLRSEQNLSPTAMNVENRLKNIKKLKIESESLPSPKWRRVVGRTDYSLALSIEQSKEIFKDSNPFETLYEISGRNGNVGSISRLIDEIITTINYDIG